MCLKTIQSKCNLSPWLIFSINTRENVKRGPSRKTVRSTLIPISPLFRGSSARFPDRAGLARFELSRPPIRGVDTFVVVPHRPLGLRVHSGAFGGLPPFWRQHSIDARGWVLEGDQLPLMWAGHGKDVWEWTMGLEQGCNIHHLWHIKRAVSHFHR